MKLKLIKTITAGYVAVSDKTAKNGEWSVSISLSPQKVELSKNTLWIEGCPKIIATDIGFNIGGLPQFQLTSIPENKWGVHQTHCCGKHGCKYRDKDCPVELGLTHGIYCETCEMDDADGGYFTKEDMKKAFFAGGNFKDIEEFNHFMNEFDRQRKLSGIEVPTVNDILSYQTDFGVNQPLIIMTEEYPYGFLQIKDYYYE